MNETDRDLLQAILDKLESIESYLATISKDTEKLSLIEEGLAAFRSDLQRR
jgi:hypothetical protein